MTLEELATLTETMIEYDVTPEGMVTARLCGAELKEGGLLAATFSAGADREEAERDYLRRISGKRLVVYAYGPRRREYWIP